LLAGMARLVGRCGAVLIGVDLKKDPKVLEPAYDDAAGVTAAFNRNLLVRINDELGGTFDLDAFAHVAVWNAPERRVEMHLESRRAQSVRIGGPASGRGAWVVEFAEGERIWTESSYKYEPEHLEAIGRRAGFSTAEQWIDGGARFALTLFIVDGPQSSAHR